MPLNVPATENIAALSASEVWAYLPNRRLTSLAIPADIIKFVGKGTGTEVPANTSIVDLIGAIPTTPELEANALSRYNTLNALIAAIPTTPELEANALARYTAIIAAIAGIPTTPELEANALARYTAIIAAIAGIPTGFSLTEEAFGTLTADGTEQEIVSKTSTTPFLAQLILDTSNIAGADDILITETIKVLSGGALKNFTRTRITSAQEEPIMIFAPKYAVRQYRATLHQLAGTYRNFDWSLVVGK